jgi:hypothetical protein
MKLLLPDKNKIDLPGSITYKERLVIVNEILSKYEDYFVGHWDNHKTVVCLDILANYLSKAPDFGGDELLSIREQREINRGSKRYVLFSDLPQKEQIALGLLDTLEFDDEE